MLQTLSLCWAAKFEENKLVKYSINAACYSEKESPTIQSLNYYNFPVFCNMHIILSYTYQFSSSTEFSLYPYVPQWL